MMHIKHLKEKQKRLQQQLTDFYTSTGLHVYFKDELTNGEINVEEVIASLEEIIPIHLTSEVEMIIIGHFDEFEKNDFNAFYDSGTICITNVQDDSRDMLDDLIHEYAHSLEEPHGMLIYGDFKMKNEFLEKRNTLHSILWNSGFKAPKSFFSEIDYNKEFDDFLHKKVGYDKLSGYCEGIFITPYAATSLREYFATGFAEFFLQANEHKYLNKLSPQLYKKIFQLYSEDSLDT